MIVVVYHTYLVGWWKNLVKKQLDRLVNSGLYDKADQIWVTINRDVNTEEEVREFFSPYPKLQLEFHELNNAEYPGIKKVKEIGDTTDSKILYFHTKGVSNNWKTYNEKEPSIEKIENVNSWRECMEYFLIDKWEESLTHLENYDNVGVSCNGGWYWGNFWWSKSEHIKKTKKVDFWTRWAYEAWLNESTPHSKNFEYFHMGFNPFLTKMDEEFYKSNFEKYKDCKIIVTSAVYGTPPFEIDEGYVTTPLNVVSDVTDLVRMYLEQKDGYKLSFNVNNTTMGCDPILGYRKVMIVEFHPEGHNNKSFKFGVTEGHNIDFQF